MKTLNVLVIALVASLTFPKLCSGEEDDLGSGSGSGMILRLLKAQLNKRAGLEWLSAGQPTSDVPVPQFLKHLYECWRTLDSLPESENITNSTVVQEHCKKAMEDDDEAEGDRLPVPMQTADTVMTFMNEGGLPVRTPVGNATNRLLKGFIAVQFNSTFQKEGTVIATEFRIHRRALIRENVSSECQSAIKEDGLFLKLWIGKLTGVNSGEYQPVDLLSERRLSAYDLERREWYLFKNLTFSSEEWLNGNSLPGISLYMTLDGECRGVDPRDIGFDDAFSTAEHQPYFTIFCNNSFGNQMIGVSRDSEDPTESRRRREANSLIPLLKKTAAEGIRSTPRPTQQTLADQKNGVCKAYDLLIPLNTISWQNLVYAPTSILTKYCAGRCSYPLDDSSTLHAVLQTMASIHLPNVVPPPCCAPKSVSPLSVIMKHENDFLLRRIPDLIVNSCACL